MSLSIVSKYWNKKLKCWWDDQWIVERNGKIYQVRPKKYWRDEDTMAVLDITHLIEVRESEETV